jgi:AcrR family transcriptional regulator
MKDASKNPTDRRTQRTRAALRDALLSLMTERGWEGIGVQDLCERANIARSTFYLHYASKDELLQGGFNDLQRHLQAGTRAASRTRVRLQDWRGFQFSTGLIEHAYENRALFRYMIGRRSGYAVQQRFREMVLRLIDHELPEPSGDLPRTAFVRQLAAAFSELLAWSIEQRTPMPVQRLVASFDRIAMAILTLEPAGSSPAA